MIAVSGIEAAEMAVTDAVDAANLGFMADAYDAAMAAMAKLNPEAPVLLVPSRSHLFYCMDCTSNVMLSVLTTFTGTTCNSGNTSWQTQTDSSQLLLVRSNCCKLQPLGFSGLRSGQASAGMKLKTSAGPNKVVQQSEHASIGNITMCSRRMEGYKFARDNLVLDRSDGKWSNRCVNAFLSHAPPGHADCHVTLEATKAEVGLLAPAVAALGATDGMASTGLATFVSFCRDVGKVMASYGRVSSKLGAMSCRGRHNFALAHFCCLVISHDTSACPHLTRSIASPSPKRCTACSAHMPKHSTAVCTSKLKGKSYFSVKVFESAFGRRPFTVSEDYCDKLISTRRSSHIQRGFSRPCRDSADKP